MHGFGLAHVLLAHSFLNQASAVVIAGVTTKRVAPPQQNAKKLPWVYEAAWDKTFSDGIQTHDPLSSCYWPAAAPLAALVADLARPGQTYVEMGCGCGLLSLTAAMHGAARCTATHHLYSHAHRTQGPRTRTAALD